MVDPEQLFSRARRVLVGGVNSPVRAFSAVGGTPPFIRCALGCRLTDEQGKQYIDYVGSYGPAILGHAHPAVTEAIARAAADGTSYGAPTLREVELAERIVACSAGTRIEQVRFVSSGTEAVMTALRIARGATGRAKVVKAAGCYHGHSDSMLVAAGSGATTLGVPSSAGVTSGAAADTVIVSYNDLPAVERAFTQHAGQIAAVIVEPVAANMGVVLPGPGYLAGLRSLCDRHGAILIFDEVITGFRLTNGPAQKLLAVTADLTTMGKIIGGGLPVGAVAGPRDIMKHLAPLGPVYQAGTLSGNPLAMAAGIATLGQLENPGVYERLEASAAALEKGLRDGAARAGMAGKVCFNRHGSMMTCFFTQGPVDDYAAATTADTKAFAAFFHKLLAAGVYIAPSQFEAMFVSLAHEPADIEQTILAAEDAFNRR